MHLHNAVFAPFNFTKLCYFFIMVILLSCRNNTSTSTRSVADKGVITEHPSAQDTTKKTILFFGDSITAGYGLDDTAYAYPALIQKKIDSLGFNYKVVNSGVSGETTAGGKSRIDWILNQEIDVFVLELGANDGLRGVDLRETRANLQSIIDAVKAKNSKTTIIIAGMQLPPNMGQAYTTTFASIFSNLASINEVALIPFILQDVGGIASLNQADGIHPTIAGHQIVSQTVWSVLEPLLIK